jgi:hypothetical protein
MEGTMAWTNDDEQLCQALLLEQRLTSAAQLGNTGGLPGSPFPCTVRTMVRTGSTGVRYYLKMPRRWSRDPLNPWNIVLLLFWIPMSVIYFIFQLLRSLAATRMTWSIPQEWSARLDPAQVSFNSWNSSDNWAIPYSGITSLGMYNDGLRVDYGNGKILINSRSAASMFVAFTHLAKGARVTAGLILPTGFDQRCADQERPVDPGRMSKNGPVTWRYPGTNSRLPLPAPAIVGYSLSAIIVLLIIIGLFA